MALSRPDVIYANTWPITATALLAGVAAIRRIPLVMNVQDLYPESLISQGQIRDHGIVAKAMYWLDGLVGRAAKVVIVISEPLRERYLQSRALAHNVRIIRNWVDRDVIDMSAEVVDVRYRAGIPEGAFVAAYGGNIGYGADVEGLIEAFSEIGTKHVFLVVAGDGPRLRKCRRLVNGQGTQAVVFWSPWAEADTSIVLRGADVLVLPTRGKQTDASVPSKLMTYMLAGRPIIAQAVPGSETARVVNECNCGWVVKPDDVHGLSAAISEASNTPDNERKALGQRARAYALANFTTDACLPQVIETIEQAAEG